MHFELTIEKVEDDGERALFFSESLPANFRDHLHRYGVICALLADLVDPDVLAPDEDPVRAYDEAASAIAEDILIGLRWEASPEAALVGYGVNVHR